MKDLLVEFLATYLPGPLSIVAAGLVLAGAFAGLISGFVAVGVYIERKVASFIQCRLGPMEVGPDIALNLGIVKVPRGWWGLGVIIADGLKMITKEDIVPANADRSLFRLAPYIAFTATLGAYCVIPVGVFLTPAELDAGVLFLLAASSVGITGIVMGGYASNNKWSLYGALRSVAQVVSYEIPLGLALLSVVLTVGSLSLADIAAEQSGWFWNWHALENVWLFLATLVYYIAGLAETNRTPFDIPEAESELISGYHTEYSGMRFGIFMLSEYANMLLVSLVCSVFFLGAHHTGIPAIDAFSWIGPFVLAAKAVFLVFVMMWLRWTLPRYRVDQLMLMCWKGLLPIALVAFLGAGMAVFQEGLAYELAFRLPILLLVALFVVAVAAGIRKAPASTRPSPSPEPAPVKAP